MKRKQIICDICGTDITKHDIRYKGKIKEYKNGYVNYDDFEFTKWKNLDVCNLCMFKFFEFVKANGDDNNAE